ncbi:SGT1 protein [Capsaspora owczarzaki ATCC 30864]|uniref:SGT1 protein n=1 Tax=Capsaspora owczarzaki (strain ATCC 30864) TaxID=595528 RepID=A0A0D2WTX2_CAPO3|nr:SGT1 protein [Capsaspora owczarzaki ATCC 30864]KJE95193.1 SGT1 protein [Capsaspora owczarzaki ATCC 30864]|eukprot:XP_004346344.1 SGT1 protein [Capsaspora owczarzaki ATCC 30864]
MSLTAADAVLVERNRAVLQSVFPRIRRRQATTTTSNSTKTTGGASTHPMTSKREEDDSADDEDDSEDDDEDDDHASMLDDEATSHTLAPNALAYRVFMDTRPTSSAHNPAGAGAGAGTQADEAGLQTADHDHPSLSLSLSLRTRDLQHVLETTITEFVKSDPAVQALCSDHLWHKDGLNLAVFEDGDNTANRATTSSASLPRLETVQCLAGVSSYGDNVGDEWLLVYILRELTARIPDLTVQLADTSDGDILLIEAADELPEWITPRIARNRVFLRQGRLHIVPTKYVPQGSTSAASSSKKSPATSTFRSHNLAERLDIVQALDILQHAAPSHSSGSATTTTTTTTTTAAWTLASAKIESCIWARLALAVREATEHVQHALALLPPTIAHLMHVQPKLVAPAIEAFVQRDSIDSRACARMSRFPVGTSPEPSMSPSDLLETHRILTRVRLTRSLFVLLNSQPQFVPPRVFGAAPPPSNTAAYSAFVLGVKIACGFEIMYAIADRQHKLSARAGQVGPAVAPPRQQLVAGYVTQNLAREIDATLLVHFNPVSLHQYDMFGSSRPAPASAPVNTNASSSTAVQQPRPEPGSVLPPAPADDSTDWMEVDPEQLEQQMTKMQTALQEVMKASEQQPTTTRSPSSKGDGSTEEDVQQLGKLASLLKGVQSFMTSKSDIDGVKTSTGLRPEMFDDPATSEDENSSEDQDDLSDEDEEADDSGDDEGDEKVAEAMFGDDAIDQLLADDVDPPLSEPDNSSESIRSAMEHMDAELRNVGLQCVIQQGARGKQTMSDEQINLAMNMLLSHEAQQGRPGPFTHLLQSFIGGQQPR